MNILHLVKIFGLFFFQTASHGHVFSSHLKNVRLTLKKNKDFFMHVTDLNTYDNLLYFSETHCSFKFFEKLAKIFMQKTTLALQPFASQPFDSQPSTHIFQVTGHNIEADYDDFYISSKKIGAYINLKDASKIDIIVDAAYKIRYKDFEAGSSSRLYYRENMLFGKHLHIQSTALNFSITSEILEANIKKQEIYLFNSTLLYPTWNLILQIGKSLYQQGQIIFKDIIVHFKEFMINIENCKFENKDLLTIFHITSDSEKFSIYAPEGTICIQKKEVYLENVVLCIKNLTLKVKKCIITTSSIVEMNDIEIFMNNNKISDVKSGSFDLQNQCLNLLNGNINV